MGRRLKLTEIRCFGCETIFTIRGRDAPRKYCSRECYRAHCRGANHPLAKQTSVTCEQCGKDYSVPPSRAERSRYCSLDCRGQARHDQPAERAKAMSLIDAAWLAGVFDGEGTVSIAQRQRADRRPTYRLSICNTCLPLIERIVDATGIDQVYRHARHNKKHRDVFVWQVGGPDALSLLRQMRPWLIVKAERADAAFEWRTFPRVARWDDIYPGKADPFADAA